MPFSAVWNGERVDPANLKTFMAVRADWSATDARVSTVDQNIEHQLSQAEAAGFVIDEVIADNGISGIATRLVERPEGRRLSDKLRVGDTLVVRWLDRLGRNYDDVCDTIREFMRRGVVIRTVINNFTFDGATADPMQRAVRDALIGFMAAIAQAQAEATKAAQKAGIEHAKAKDGAAYLGRKPSYTRQQFDQVRTLLGQDAVGIARIAKEARLSRQIVYRIKDDPVGARRLPPPCQSALARSFLQTMSCSRAGVRQSASA
jgi:putative DNA-invertase from lambdoid prophage Rac